MITLANLYPGDGVYLLEESRPYRVQCRDERYIICTKPFNLKHTVEYFIIDLERQVRGPDDRVFCSGYETREQCEERLKELQAGQIEVSYRRSVPLEKRLLVEHVKRKVMEAVIWPNTY